MRESFAYSELKYLPARLSAGASVPPAEFHRQRVTSPPNTRRQADNTKTISSVRCVSARRFWFIARCTLPFAAMISGLYSGA